MTSFTAADWQPMASAPRDGTLVLVRVRATEQGPDEHDMVRWSKSARSGEESWVATDSDPFARIAYADNEIAAWMPLPTQLPELRSTKPGIARRPSADETDGSGV
jgi:hypothetical protein